jgi:multidrug resistance efflux pump
MKTAEANMHLAQTTSVRWQGLLGKNAVSKQETDQMTSDYAARQATYAASQANVRRLKELQGYLHPSMGQSLLETPTSAH